MQETTVLLVEDHPIFSRGLAQLIETQKPFKVIGEAATIAEAMSFIKETPPTLAIVDLNLGDEDGLELIRMMKQHIPSLLILVLSMYDERYYAERALKAGAKGYVMKEEACQKIIEALKTIISGKIWLSDNERAHLADYSTNAQDPLKNTDLCASLHDLSNRQLQIFTMLGKGLGTIEIATKLELSTKTIDAHKEHIKQKLHVNSAQELRQLAVEWVARDK